MRETFDGIANESSEVPSNNDLITQALPKKTLEQQAAKDILSWLKPAADSGMSTSETMSSGETKTEELTTPIQSGGKPSAIMNEPQAPGKQSTEPLPSVECKSQDESQTGATCQTDHLSIESRSLTCKETLSMNELSEPVEALGWCDKEKQVDIETSVVISGSVVGWDRKEEKFHEPSKQLEVTSRNTEKDTANVYNFGNENEGNKNCTSMKESNKQAGWCDKGNSLALVDTFGREKNESTAFAEASPGPRVGSAKGPATRVRDDLDEKMHSSPADAEQNHNDYEKEEFKQVETLGWGEATHDSRKATKLEFFQDSVKQEDVSGWGSSTTTKMNQSGWGQNDQFTSQSNTKPPHSTGYRPENDIYSSPHNYDQTSRYRSNSGQISHDSDWGKRDFTGKRDYNNQNGEYYQNRRRADSWKSNTARPPYWGQNSDSTHYNSYSSSTKTNERNIGGWDMNRQIGPPPGFEGRLPASPGQFAEPCK